jgi:hypothetical protein
MTNEFKRKKKISSNTPSTNDVKATIRNRIEVIYLDMHLKQLDREKTHLEYLRNKNIYKMEKELGRLRVSTGRSTRTLNGDNSSLAQNSFYSMPSSAVNKTTGRSDVRSDSDMSLSSSSRDDDEDDDEKLIREKSRNTNRVKSVHVKKEVSFLDSLKDFDKLIQTESKKLEKANKALKTTGSDKINKLQNFEFLKSSFINETYKNPEKLNELKRKDPIFAKRFSQFQLFKLTGRAPVFDQSDLDMFKQKAAISKACIERQKREMIKSANSVMGSAARHEDLCVQHRLQQRVNYFIKNLDLFQ